MQTLKISQENEKAEYPRLIGLAGIKGVGKTTFAFQVGGDVISLATPIKKMLEVIVPKLFIYEEKESSIPGFPEGVNARRLMQTLGTDWGRNIYPDIWLNFVEEKIVETQAKSSQRIIIDDIRFKNEAEMIRRNNGEIWRLKRAGVRTEDNHISEAGISDDLIDKEIWLDA